MRPSWVISPTPRTDTREDSLSMAIKSLPRGGKIRRKACGKITRPKNLKPAQPQRLGSLNLAFFDGLNARPENLGGKGPIADRQGDNPADDKANIPVCQHGKAIFRTQHAEVC